MGVNGAMDVAKPLPRGTLLKDDFRLCFRTIGLSPSHFSWCLLPWWWGRCCLWKERLSVGVRGGFHSRACERSFLEPGEFANRGRGLHRARLCRTRRVDGRPGSGPTGALVVQLPSPTLPSSGLGIAKSRCFVPAAPSHRRKTQVDEIWNFFLFRFWSRNLWALKCHGLDRLIQKQLLHFAHFTALRVSQRHPLLSPFYPHLRV